MSEPLRRLLAHRGLGAEEADAPDAALVRRLAPALGLHTADLFVIAGLDLPADLAPAHGTVSNNAGRIVESAARLMPRLRGQVHDFVRSLPEHPPAPVEEPVPAGPGPLLVRLLGNRNIHPWNAKLLAVVGDGPYVSDSTIAMLGAGRVPLTPRFVTGIAHLLAIGAGDLAAMTGVPPVADPRPHPHWAELAELAWDARRLTVDQVIEVKTRLDELSREDPREFCRRCGTFHVRSIHHQAAGADPALRERFEHQLDRLLARLCPEWTPPDPPPDADAVTVFHARLTAKRRQVTARLTDRPGDASAVIDLVMDAIVHDSDTSANRELVHVLLGAGHHRAVLTGLLEVVATGTPQERICAAQAWSWAWPWSEQLHDAGALCRRFHSACLAAFTETADPDARLQLSYRFSLDPARHPAGLRDTVHRARQIAEADPERYQRLLAR